jgi:hypothetical protein
MNFRAENNEIHHGFQMTFQNGCTISIQFNGHNYCDEGKTTAEVAVWDKDDNWYVLNEEDNHMSLIKVEECSDVIGHCTTDLVASIMELTRKLK